MQHNLLSLATILVAIFIASVYSSEYQFQDKEYLLLAETHRFDEATELCNDRKYELLLTKSKEENDYIFEIIKPHQNLIWLAIRRVSYLQNFKNSDGQELKFTNWRAREPSTVGSAAVMSPNDGEWNTFQDDTWNYERQNAAVHVMCQRNRKADKPPVDSHDDSTDDSPDNSPDDSKDDLQDELPDDSPKHSAEYSFKDKEYFFSNKKRTFEEAIKFCTDRNEALLQIRDQLENDYVFKIIAKNQRDLWVAIAAAGGDKKFKRLDGQEIKFTNWRKKSSSNHDEKSAVKMAHRDGKWKGVPVNHRQRVMCERNKRKHRFQDKEYYFSEKKLTFDGAIKFCKDRNENLLQIDSQLENDYILKVIHESGHYTWLAAMTTKGDDKFVKLNGGKLTFTNWQYGYPDQYAIFLSGVRMSHIDGKWANSPVSHQETFCCEGKVIGTF